MLVMVLVGYGVLETASVDDVKVVMRDQLLRMLRLVLILMLLIARDTTSSFCV